MKRQNVRVSSDRHAAVVPGPARSAPFTPSPLGVTTGRHSSPDAAGPGSTTSTSLAPESGPSPACESPSRWSSPHHSGVPRAPEPEAPVGGERPHRDVARYQSCEYRDAYTPSVVRRNLTDGSPEPDGTSNQTLATDVTPRPAVGSRRSPTRHSRPHSTRRRSRTRPQ